MEMWYPSRSFWADATVPGRLRHDDDNNDINYAQVNTSPGRLSKMSTSHRAVMFCGWEGLPG